MIDYLRNKVNKVLPLVAAVALYVSGCAGLQTGADKPRLNPMERAYIYSCPDYQVSVSEEPDLRVIAGLLAGTIKAHQTKTPEGVEYFAEGEFREFEFPKMMAKACQLADSNKDGFIVDGEAEAAAQMAMKYFAEKAEAGKQ